MTGKENFLTRRNKMYTFYRENTYDIFSSKYYKVHNLIPCVILYFFRKYIINLMIDIDWNQFKVKNKNYRVAFEDLCYYLFCREFKITNGIKADFNQVGLETYPVKYGDKYYGFQAKFFEHSADYRQVENSVNKALGVYKRKLNVIYIYTASNLRLNSQRVRNIEKIAKKKDVDIKWITKSKFKVLLNKPTNLDLAQLYFGVGDEIGFLKDSFPVKISTLLQSSEYTSLPLQLVNQKAKVITSDKLGEEILKGEAKEILVTGHPGSGKSILMYKLFQEFGGLNSDGKDGLKEIRRVIDRNKAIPMFIDLKHCTSDSLENLVRNRKRDFNIGDDTEFIYLLDGLDEVSENRINGVLLDINGIKEKSDTKKIVISSRLGTGNLSLLRMYNSEIIKYRINNLDNGYIDKFFKAKGDTAKNKKLDKLKQDNAQILDNINDILLIELLWDTIDKLDKDSTVVDLFNNKLKLLLNSPEHRKNLEELNLLNPKGKEIEKINKELVYNLQKDFRLSFTGSELQNLILNMYPRVTYKEVNAIVEYLAKSFFDYQGGKDQELYTYQHRTYQEFFLAQKLKEEYDKDPSVLRRLNILPNKSFFEGLFLKYLRSTYKSENNIIGLIELGVISKYLSMDRYWGADKLYYANSDEFVPALASQDDSILERLLEDENLQVMGKVMIDIGKLKKNFSVWNKDKENFETENYLRDIYQTGIAFLIRAISIFHKQGKKRVVKRLIANLEEVENLFKENKFVEYYEADPQSFLENPYWKELENQLYFYVVIENRDINEVFDKIIRGNYKNVADEIDYDSRKSNKQKLIEAFFKVSLRHKKKSFLALVKSFDEDEFLSLLNVLSDVEFIPIALSDIDSQNEIKEFIRNYKPKSFQPNLHIALLFFKKLLQSILLKEERNFIYVQYKEVKENLGDPAYMNRKDFSLYNLLAFTSQELTLQSITKDARKSPHDDYYNGYILYVSLFDSFVKLLKGKVSIKEIVRDYILYINTHQRSIHEPYQKDFYKREISILWAHIFSQSKIDTNSLVFLKNQLLNEESALDFIAFANELNKINKDISSKLINESELEKEWIRIEKEEKDFHNYIDNCFKFASLFAPANKQKAFSLIIKGINDGILRHGYHKDTIVSYGLVDSLEILWENNWLSKKELIRYTLKVFDLTCRVAEMTDGKETWKGPARVVGLVANNYNPNIALAEKLKNSISERDTSNYYLIDDAITNVLFGKIKLGYPINDIEEEIEEYASSYYGDYVYKKKWEVYLSIALSNSYTKNERKAGFEKAYKQVEIAKSQNFKYFLIDLDLEKEREEYIKLCRRYGKEPNITMEDKKDSGTEKNHLMSEEEFIQEVQKSRNKKELRELYKKLNNRKNNIVLKSRNTWDILIERTFQIFGNLQQFTELLRNNNFPGMFYYSHNIAHSLYYGVAAALRRNDTKAEIESYLIENNGYYPYFTFLNVMKSYAAVPDRKMCINLFKRYLRFCEFLVT